MATNDDALVRALVHDAHVILTSDTEHNLARERDLDHVKAGIALADKILAGSASEADKASVAGFVHPSVRGLYLA